MATYTGPCGAMLHELDSVWQCEKKRHHKKRKHKSTERGGHGTHTYKVVVTWKGHSNG